MFDRLVQKLKSPPQGFYILFYTEVCELFGRFGITALLVLYLTKSLHFSDAKAFIIFSTFISLLFITPVIGGILCDRLLGNNHAIILGAAIMGVGNLLLSLNQAHKVCLWPGYSCYR